jgi:lipopolysaccharide export LptBFGC system permease protein LptF
MPIDLSTVNWLFVGLMALFAFVAALLGSLIAYRNRFLGAIIAGILFAVIFVLWNHYPHPTISLPIIATYTTPNG